MGQADRGALFACGSPVCFPAVTNAWQSPPFPAAGEDSSLWPARTGLVIAAGLTGGCAIGVG